MTESPPWALPGEMSALPLGHTPAKCRRHARRGRQAVHGPIPSLHSRAVVPFDALRASPRARPFCLGRGEARASDVRVLHVFMPSPRVTAARAAAQTSPFVSLCSPFLLYPSRAQHPPVVGAAREARVGWAGGKGIPASPRPRAASAWCHRSADRERRSDACFSPRHVRALFSCVNKLDGSVGFLLMQAAHQERGEEVQAGMPRAQMEGPNPLAGAIAWRECLSRTHHLLPTAVKSPVLAWPATPPHTAGLALR